MKYCSIYLGYTFITLLALLFLILIRILYKIIMSSCRLDAKFKPGTLERYTAIVQDYADCLNTWAIADKYHMSETSIGHVFKRMHHLYGAVNSTNLVAIMLREGDIK